MDRLDALRLFTRAAALGSFSATAREQGVSQAHVSRTIRQLEARLGCTLMLRTTRALTPTAEGRRLLDTARAVLDAYEAAEESVREHDEPSGPLRVTAPVGVGQRVIAPIVDTLLQTHPGLSVDLTLTDRFVDLVAEGIDVAVRLGNAGAGSLKRRRVGKAARMLVASPAYLAGHPRVRRPEALAGLRCFRIVAGRSPGRRAAFAFQSPRGAP
ncbi:MAG: LysR family transcriptional regulator [Myxococcota bacterium]